MFFPFSVGGFQRSHEPIVAGVNRNGRIREIAILRVRGRETRLVGRPSDERGRSRPEPLDTYDSATGGETVTGK